MRARGIGQLGLGSITEQHRQGYARFGLPVVAGYDPASAAQARFRADRPSARVHASMEALLEDPAVGVVDVAVPHHRAIRLAVVRAVAEAGRPMLIQKPLAESYEQAVELAEIVRGNGVSAMVNQNMCFNPAAITLTDAVLRGNAVGAPSVAVMQVQYQFDTDGHPWFGRDSRWWTSALTVHHLGLLHLLFGPPETVYALIGHDSEQPGVVSDGYGHLSLTYPGGMQALVLSTGTYIGVEPRIHGREHLWIQGADGLLDWNADGSTTLSRRAGAGSAVVRTTIPTTVPGEWFPDAFGLTMLHLQQALDAGRTPLCSVDDNLYVVAAIEAAYRSGEANRVVPLEEVMGRRYDPGYGPGWRHGFDEWVPPALDAERSDDDVA